VSEAAGRGGPPEEAVGRLVSVLEAVEHREHEHLGERRREGGQRRLQVRVGPGGDHVRDGRAHASHVFLVARRCHHILLRRSALVVVDVGGSRGGEAPCGGKAQERVGSPACRRRKERGT